MDSSEEWPWNMNQGDPRKALKRFNSFLTKRHFLHPPDHVLIVRIVSKPLPDLGERIAAEDSLEPEAEVSIITKSADGGEGVARHDAPKRETEESSIVKNEAEGSSLVKNVDDREGSSLVKNVDADGREGNATENSLKSEAERSSIVKNSDINFLQPDEREGIPVRDSLKQEAEGSSVIKNSESLNPNHFSSWIISSTPNINEDLTISFH